MRGDIASERRVAVQFPTIGPFVLDTSAVAWERFVSISAVVEDGIVQPYGYDGYASLLCPASSCITAANSTVVLQFAQAPFLDIYADQTVQVSFNLRLTPRTAVPTVVQFKILAQELSAAPEAYFLSAALIPAHIVSAFMLPSVLDTAGLVLTTQSACSRSSERLWVPGALYAVLPFGGDSLFERSWRLGLFLIAVYTGLLLLVKFNTLNCVDTRRAIRVREMLPFIAGQIVLYLAPGLSFAAGSLLTSPRPTYQVLGVAVVLGVAIAVHAMHGWLYRADEWRYEPSSSKDTRQLGRPDELSFPSLLRGLFVVRGQWLNDTTPFRVTKIVPREARGEPAQRRTMLGLWVLTMALYAACGIAPPDPVSCVVQGAVVGTAWVVTAVIVMRVRPYRALCLDIASALLRFTTGCAFGLVALQPDGSKYILFCLLMSCGVALEVPRVLFAALVLRPASSEAARVYQKECAELLLQHERRKAEEEARLAADEEDRAANAKAEAEEEAREMMHAPLLVFPMPVAASDAVGAGDLNGPDEGASTAHMYDDTADAIYGPDDPVYLREAKKIRPRPALADERLDLRPAWVPVERPLVRSHNFPDLPLPQSLLEGVNLSGTPSAQAAARSGQRRAPRHVMEFDTLF